jgi:hypothetical protein
MKEFTSGFESLLKDKSQWVRGVVTIYFVTSSV